MTLDPLTLIYVMYTTNCIEFILVLGDGGLSFRTCAHSLFYLCTLKMCSNKITFVCFADGITDFSPCYFVVKNHEAISTEDIGLS